MNQELKVGDNVIVMRQIGKNGPREEVTGVIERFTNGITIRGQLTAVVKYDDNKCDPYVHPIPEIKLITD